MRTADSVAVFLLVVASSQQLAVPTAPLSALTPIAEVLQPGALLAFPPATTGNAPQPMVFVNGLLQRPLIDYTITGRTLTFTYADLGDNATVQVVYWHAIQ